jgi:hypothetical protein
MEAITAPAPASVPGEQGMEDSEVKRWIQRSDKSWRPGAMM